ncbi:MAG: hypothetical protein AB7R89_16065 [Dehalococcoidia bacterium]
MVNEYLLETCCVVDADGVTHHRMRTVPLCEYNRLLAAAHAVVDWSKPTAVNGKYAPYVLVPVQVMDALRDALAATEGS